MKAEHQAILTLLSEWLEAAPDQRFTQALFNLGVNGFLDPENPSRKEHALRDPYNDSDAAVLRRMRARLEEYRK